MRLEFLTQDDPLYILPFFAEFLPAYGGEFEVLGVSSTRAMGGRSRVRMARELLWLYGPPGLLRLLAERVVAQLRGRLPRPRGASRYFSLEQVCRAHGVPYVRTGNPNRPEFVAALRERAPDVLVSVACPYILKAEVLSVPRLGAINIHHAPLPRYKGMMPTFWQLFHGESRVGVTVHAMAARVDEGAALLQEDLEVTPGETLDHLIRRSKRHGAHCMARALRGLADGTTRPAPLAGPGSYFTFPTRDEIREFARRGHRAI